VRVRLRAVQSPRSETAQCCSACVRATAPKTHLLDVMRGVQRVMSATANVKARSDLRREERGAAACMHSSGACHVTILAGTIRLRCRDALRARRPAMQQAHARHLRSACAHARSGAPRC
jgi:hypothetical protein